MPTKIRTPLEFVRDYPNTIQNRNFLIPTPSDDMVIFPTIVSYDRADPKVSIVDGLYPQNLDWYKSMSIIERNRLAHQLIKLSLAVASEAHNPLDVFMGVMKDPKRKKK